MSLIDLLKDKPVMIPKILFNNYKLMDISDSELIVIMLIMSLGDKPIYDPIGYANMIKCNKKDIMILINNLIDKHLLEIEMVKDNKKSYECISLDMLYEKLENIVIDNKKEEKEIDSSIFTIFENEVGKPLSPMEYEQIKEWITSGNSEEIIILALKEAVMNGVSNFKYIDKILNEWKKKGIKNKEDIMKEKDKYHTKKSNTKEVFYTDWLNE